MGGDLGVRLVGRTPVAMYCFTMQQLTRFKQCFLLLRLGYIY
jgi:hypothetical protein